MSNEIVGRSAELLEAEYRQRMEDARIEHEPRTESMEAEAVFFDHEQGTARLKAVSEAFR